LQRILTFLPFTLSSAIVYCALHAWQVTFIAGGTVSTIRSICRQLAAFSLGRWASPGADSQLAEQPVPELFFRRSGAVPDIAA
jgi:hypothetical protein